MSDDPLLPPLRADLEFYTAPDKPQGSPEWMIRDPLHASFEKVSWQQMEILRLLGKPIHLSELQSLLHKKSTLRLSDKELLDFCNDLGNRGLTAASQQQPVEHLCARENAKKIKPLKWLLGHYLYFRIPLLHPDNFLQHTLPYIKVFFGRLSFYMLAFCFLASLFVLSQNFESYTNTFTYFFNWQGALLYGITLTLVKAVHEFSHAYSAKAMGNRVPTMGLAFIVMWPVPYCDVTDSWRMQSRKKRLAISAAGVIAEITMASLALLFWALLPDGPVRSVMFMVSSISLLGTLAVNLNPAMRFDGYYIFSDLIRIDNLQQRAFAFFLWSYRGKFFGIKSPCPEKNITPAKHILLHIYAVYAVLYRLFLYLGIAALVYYAFHAKLLGIALFTVEIVFFLIRPVINELGQLWKLRRRIHPNFIRIGIWILSGFLLIWLSLPLPRRKSLPAITVPKSQQIIFSPAGGQVTDLQIQQGKQVESGQALAYIISGNLQEDIFLSRLQLQAIQEELDNLVETPQGREMLGHKREQRAQITARLHGLLRQQRHNHITANTAGIIYLVNDELSEGMTVPAGYEMGRIAIPGDIKINGYIPQSLMNAVTTGSKAFFYPADNSPRISGTITLINQSKKQTLPFPALASVNGGDIAVTYGHNHELLIKDGYYEFTFTPNEKTDSLRFEQPGKVWVETNPRSIILEWLHHAQSVIIRESGF